MRKILIFATLYKVIVVFRKESFINVKKVLTFIQSLINEKKVIKSLMPFHTISGFGDIIITIVTRMKMRHTNT